MRKNKTKTTTTKNKKKKKKKKEEEEKKKKITEEEKEEEEAAAVVVASAAAAAVEEEEGLTDDFEQVSHSVLRIRRVALLPQVVESVLGELHQLHGVSQRHGFKTPKILSQAPEQSFYHSCFFVFCFVVVVVVFFCRPSLT